MAATTAANVITAPRPGRPQVPPEFLVREMEGIDLSKPIPTTSSERSTSVSPSPPTTPPRFSPPPHATSSGSIRGWDTFLRRVRSKEKATDKHDKKSSAKSSRSNSSTVSIDSADEKEKDKRGLSAENGTTKRSSSFSLLGRIRKSNGKRSREDHLVGHNGMGVRSVSPESEKSDKVEKSHTSRQRSLSNAGQAFAGEYGPIRVLGRGLYGVVYHCRELGGEHREVAVKTVPSHLLVKTECRKLMDQMIMERETLRLIQEKPRDTSKDASHLTTNEEAAALLMNGPSPYIVHMYKAFHDAFYTFIVLECVSGGDLFTLLHERGRKEGIGAPMTRVMAAEITCALEYLHLRDLVYRDLKPENVLLTNDGHIKLTDFGFCKSVFGCKRRTTNQVCGTLQYLSPECIWQAGHGQEADFWALGILIHEMLALTTPFDDAKNKYEVMSAITSGDIPIAEEIFDVCPEAYDLVSRMLDPRKSERIGWCTRSHTIYEHCFFKDLNWDDIRLNKVPIPGWVRAPVSMGSTDTITSDGSDEASEKPVPVLGVMSEYRRWAQGVGTEKEHKHFNQIMAQKFDYPTTSQLV